MGGTRRRRVEPTGEWGQLRLLCRWPEQLAYEEIRPAVLFGSSERTLYRMAARFDREGMDSLFDSAGAKRRELPPIVRRIIVELKAEHPGFSLGEIATICYIRAGRRPGKHTVERSTAILCAKRSGAGPRRARRGSKTRSGARRAGCARQA